MKKMDDEIINKISHFNYRIVLRRIEMDDGLASIYDVAEVYYDKQNEPCSWTKDSVDLRSWDRTDLLAILRHINDALEQTVLVEVKGKDGLMRLYDTGLLMPDDDDINIEDFEID